MQTQATAPTARFGGDVRAANGRVTVLREQALRSPQMDALVRDAVFGRGQARDQARWLIWEIGQAVGVYPASINDLYLARGRGEIGGFTVPAINVRGMAYDTARSIFRAAITREAGAFIVEIARSEIAYTDQRPAEYVTVVLAAALREGFRGPVFIQGDHFQVNAKRFAEDAIGEIAAVKQLAFEAVQAGFYNIDVDTSTLVDLSRPTLEEQQALNARTAADIVAYIRAIEPDGVTVAVGGEIGEVGAHNSTVPELRAFMNGFSRALRERAPVDTVGLSKISVQTGTSHGGVVLPDGSMAEVDLDFGALEQLSYVARTEYGLGGAVQHGASTLPESAFHHFPLVEAAEIHLATNFQNILFEHLPRDLKETIYGWLEEHARNERKPADSDEQFFYRARKKALGPFKRELWDLPPTAKEQCAAAYERRFGFLFDQLRIAGTADLVARYVRTPDQHRRIPDDATSPIAAAPDDPDAGE